MNDWQERHRREIYVGVQNAQAYVVDLAIVYWALLSFADKMKRFWIRVTGNPGAQTQNTEHLFSLDVHDATLDGFNAIMFLT